MDQSPTTIDFRAVLLGLRIDTRGLEHPDTISLSPLTLRVGRHGVAFAFRFGVVVFAGVPLADEGPVLDVLRPRVVDPLEIAEADRLTATLNAGGEDRLEPTGALFLKDATPERLQVVANVLAKSLVLAHHETRLAVVFDRIDVLAMEIKRSGRGMRHARELVRQVGDSLLTQHRMVGRVAVEDKPDILWDWPELERLYARLADEYELLERGRAVDRKLTLAGDTIRTLLELVQNQRAVRLEWYIIILIAIEILLSLYEMFIRGH
ncbi:RMD1 family protein [Reyranella sp.]|uniref:RMD1 family protein n=1 Tax=Reyranella sp. TaxID=1929291 RepID=UPI003BA9B69A